MSPIRMSLLALACAVALPVTAQNPPASARPPSTHGVDANRAAENAMRIDGAVDERRRSGVDETTDEAEAPLVPDRVGQVQIVEIEATGTEGSDSGSGPVGDDDDGDEPR